MAKKLEPQDAKPFQPIKAAYLRGVLDDDPPPPVEKASPPENRVEPSARQEARTRRETDTETFPEMPRKVVPMPVEEETPAPRRGRSNIPVHAGERLNRPFKLQLQASERVKLTRIVNDLSSSCGTALSVSHVTRALLMVFCHAEKEIHEKARQRGPLKRPSNDDLTGIAVFEQEIAKLLLGALRNAKPLRE